MKGTKYPGKKWRSYRMNQMPHAENRRTYSTCLLQLISSISPSYSFILPQLNWNNEITTPFSLDELGMLLFYNSIIRVPHPCTDLLWGPVWHPPYLWSLTSDCKGQHTTAYGISQYVQSVKVTHYSLWHLTVCTVIPFRMWLCIFGLYFNQTLALTLCMSMDARSCIHGILKCSS
jgi:hypothetical protein